VSSLSFSLKSLDYLLPNDPSFDSTNECCKKYLFAIQMIICEVNKSWWKSAHSNLNTKFDEIKKEMILYKIEYECLLNETLPELQPEDIEDNYDTMNVQTLDTLLQD
jgi:hypothetical protein